MADILILSTADWDHPLWTNKQHLAMTLASMGHRVIYVESLGIRLPRLKGKKDRDRILKRFRRLLKPLRRSPAGVWILSPPVLPGLVTGTGLKLNQLLLRLSLSFVTLRLRLHDSILWTFNPLTTKYLSLNHFSQTVYHCVDRIQAQPGMPVNTLDKAEKELCRSVDVVFTTSPNLKQRLVKFNPNTYYYGNVADAAHFRSAQDKQCPRPADLPKQGQPTLIFIGAIDAYKLALEELVKLISRTPHWNYVFIGPVGECDPSTDVSELIELANTSFLGIRPYAELPSYLAHSDVALLPLRMNEYTENMYPMKFFEYLASGCPVVASSIPSLIEHADVATLCNPTAESFEEAIEAVLNGNCPDLQLRLECAQKHTYSRRTEDMLSHLPISLS